MSDRFTELEILVAIVEAGSISAAAERLNLAKSVVSRRLADLERRLGTRLIHRTTRRLSLTDAGRLFNQRARTILDDLAEAEQSVAADQANLSGRLRVAAPLSFGLRHLSPLVNELLARHPQLSLELDLNDREVNLIEEGVDLAVRIGQLEDSSLVARRLAPIRRILVASPAYLAEHGHPQIPEELNQHQGLTYANISKRSQWHLRDAQDRDHYPEPATRLRCNNGELLLEAAIAGMGVALQPTFITHQALAVGQLERLLPDCQGEQAGLFVVYPPGRLITRRARVFTELLVERFGDHPYWDEG